MSQQRWQPGLAVALAVGFAAQAWATDFQLDLNWNFNGMVHLGDPNGGPDAPDGYRAISDRGLLLDGGSISFGTNPLIGFGGITYDIVRDARELDLVHLGNRNTVAGGAHAFDPNADGDNNGTQPAWLPDPDQSGPQSTDLTGQNLTLDVTGEVGILYQISNGGGNFDVTLTFDDATSVTLTVNGPDWFQDQDPGAPGPGVISQTQFGVFAGTTNKDAPVPEAPLNVVEAIISVQEMINDGLGNFVGKTLTAITFSNRSNTNASYGILAATVRTGLGPPDNNDCENCTPISEGLTLATNARATGTDDSSCGDADTTSVWFCYTAGASGLAQASTCTSEFDTSITVYNNCGGVEIACDDDACLGQSIVQWQAQSGATYLIRVAGENAAEGDIELLIENPVSDYDNTPLPLTYNFNGMAHVGESMMPDDPDGYRSISDRGMRLNGAPTGLDAGGLVGASGIRYSVEQNAGVLDMVHVGNRNGVDNGNWAFDPNADGDNVGTQPTWLLDPNQGTATSDLSGLNLTLTPDSEIGVVFNVSNGGGDLDVTVSFTDATSFTVTVNGPDWFGSQSPDPNGVGLVSQTSLGTFAGSESVDAAIPGFVLNLTESIISVEELMLDGVGDFAGKTIDSITFDNRSSFTAGYGVYAVTHRALATADCPGDSDDDNDVDFDDLLNVLGNFGTAGPLGDVDDDGDVDFDDLLIVLGNFGTMC